MARRSIRAIAGKGDDPRYLSREGRRVVPIVGNRLQQPGAPEFVDLKSVSPARHGEARQEPEKRSANTVSPPTTQQAIPNGGRR